MRGSRRQVPQDGARVAGRRRRSDASIRLALAVLTSASAVLSAPAAAAAPRPRVGLALGGGAAKGIAHVGVLQWLEENRIPVDCIAGTSMGGLVGGAYATGMSAAEIGALLREVDWDLVFRPDAPYALESFRRKEDTRDYPIQLELGLRDGLHLPSSLNPGHHIGLLLCRIALPCSDRAGFDALPIPFRCVATDLCAAVPVVLESGSLATALRATMAIPGIFDPVHLDGRVLADGGVANNVPADVVRAMGAGIVIAVDVTAPTLQPLDESLTGLAARALDIMMAEAAERRLAQADLVIRPDLRGVLATDWRRSDAIAARGYAAAAAHRDALLRFALEPGSWSQHLAERRRRRCAEAARPEFVAVEGVPQQAAAPITRRLLAHAGEPLDPAALDRDLTRIVGDGRWASAGYALVRRDGRPGLGVTLQEKPHAPPSLDLSLDVNNEREDFDFNFGGRVTFLDLTTQGSEWRLDASIGSTTRLATELLQPLGGSRLFVAPRAEASRTRDHLYRDDALVAVYRRERLGAGGDLGLLWGDRSQLRMGYDIAAERSTVRVGDPLLPETEGAVQTAGLCYRFEGLDRPAIPRRGVRLEAIATWFLVAPDAPRDFGQLQARFAGAVPIRAHDRLLVLAEGGGTVGGPSPVLEQFALGGPFRLGAFGVDEFRGEEYALGSLGYLLSLGRLPDFLGQRWFVGGFVEAGSAFPRPAAATLEASCTLGLAADLVLGPAFVGANVGTHGAFRIYFTVGKLVR